MPEIANTDLMFQTATYWPPAPLNRYGQPDEAARPAPELLRCRWQDQVELHYEATEREFRSNAIVYPEKVVERAGWMALGDFTDTADPTQVDSAYQVRDVKLSPDIFNELQEVKVWL